VKIILKTCLHLLIAVDEESDRGVLDMVLMPRVSTILNICQEIRSLICLLAVSEDKTLFALPCFSQ
jgi:hypothetical protein